MAKRCPRLASARAQLKRFDYRGGSLFTNYYVLSKRPDWACAKKYPEVNNTLTFNELAGGSVNLATLFDPKFDLTGALRVTQSGREMEILANGNSERLIAELQSREPEDLRCESLSLEEIFVASGDLSGKAV